MQMKGVLCGMDPQQHAAVISCSEMATLVYET